MYEHLMKISFHDNKKAPSKMISSHYTAIATKISTSYKNNMTLFGVKTLIIPLKKKSLLETAKSMAEKKMPVSTLVWGQVLTFFFYYYVRPEKVHNSLEGCGPWF